MSFSEIAGEVQRRETAALSDYQLAESAVDALIDRRQNPFAGQIELSSIDLGNTVAKPVYKEVEGLRGLNVSLEDPDLRGLPFEIENGAIVIKRPGGEISARGLYVALWGATQEAAAYDISVSRHIPDIIQETPVGAFAADVLKNPGRRQHPYKYISTTGDTGLYAAYRPAEEYEEGCGRAASLSVVPLEGARASFRFTDEDRSSVGLPGSIANLPRLADITIEGPMSVKTYSNTYLRIKPDKVERSVNSAQQIDLDDARVTVSVPLPHWAASLAVESGVLVPRAQYRTPEQIKQALYADDASMHQKIAHQLAEWEDCTEKFVKDHRDSLNEPHFDLTQVRQEIIIALENKAHDPNAGPIYPAAVGPLAVVSYLKSVIG